MSIFATNIVVTSNGVEKPSPVIQNPPTVSFSKIQAKEFIVTGPIKKEHVASEPRYSHLEASEIVVTGPIKKEHVAPEPRYTHIQAKEIIIKNDPADLINSLPDVAAVKQSDFIEKSSGYMQHIFQD